MLYRKPSPYNGAHGMYHIIAGQVKCRGDLRLSRGLLVSLVQHQFITIVPQLYSGVGMNAIIDAVVTGLIASRHAAVGRIYDGSHLQSRNIPFPQINLWGQFLHICRCYHAFGRIFL